MYVKPDIFTGPKVLFNLFRRELAIASQILEPGKYFGTPDDGIDWKAIAKHTDFYGYWSEEPKDPIWYLLAHYDNNGFLSVKHTELLIPRLKSLTPSLPGKELYPNWQTFNKEFTSNLAKAVKDNTEITFG